MLVLSRTLHWSWWCELVHRIIEWFSLLGCIPDAFQLYYTFIQTLILIDGFLKWLLSGFGCEWRHLQNPQDLRVVWTQKFSPNNWHFRSEVSPSQALTKVTEGQWCYENVTVWSSLDEKTQHNVGCAVCYDQMWISLETMLWPHDYNFRSTRKGCNVMMLWSRPGIWMRHSPSSRIRFEPHGVTTYLLSTAVCSQYANWNNIQ